jgi:hypothetical protein
MIAQQSGDEVAQRIGDKEAARTPIDVAEFLAAKSDYWGVDDRKHLVDMIEKQAIEENFVGVLKLAEIDVALEIVRFQGKSLIGANALIVERLDDGRKKAVEAETLALVFGESGALVEGWIVE